MIYFEEKKYLRCLLSSYTPDKIQNLLKKGACFLFICFDKNPKNFMFLLFTFSYVLKNLKSIYIFVLIFHFFNLLTWYFSSQQTSLRRNWTLQYTLVLTGFSSIQFFNSSPFPNIVSETNQGTLPLTFQHLCDLWNAMLLPFRYFPPNPNLGKRRISLRGTSILTMCLCLHA